MLLSCALIVQALVKFDEIHVQLNSVQRPLRWALRQVSQSCVVFANSLFTVLLESRNFSANSVQPIVVRIDRGGTPEEWLRVFERTSSDFGLRRGKLQTQVGRSGIGSLRVQPRGFILAGVELIGICELGFHLEIRAADRL